MVTIEMASFVEKVTEAVRILDVSISSSGALGAARSHESTDLEDLAGYLEDASHQRNACRVMYGSSHAFATTLGPNMRRAVRYPVLLGAPVVFLQPKSRTGGGLWRTFHNELAGFVSCAEKQTEVLYTLKYPEFKMSEGKWPIHLDEPNAEVANAGTGVSAPSGSPSYNLGRRLLAPSSFALHTLPAWRQYIAAQEKEFLPKANSTFATFIDEPLRLGYDTLSTLVALQNRFLQVPVIMEHTTQLSDELSGWLVDLSDPHPSKQTIKFGAELRNHKRHCQANARSAEYLQRRAQSVAQLLSDTLSFRDQVEAKIQNGNMIQLNKSAVFITALTLLYLPSSFVASIFGMNFFDYDGETGRLVGTSMVWIYVVSSALLTSITMLFYYWLLKRDGALFESLAPKVRVTADWVQTPFASMTRRLTNRGNVGIELKELPI
ncbi:hypothetical protein PG997_004215 [Apiospora hydei]|uniref:Uncharacterized protein n=1 Tax=Apiospora hydei TaxID=1337664 RepID=A0ABR1X1P2_9PEZI